MFKKQKHVLKTTYRLMRPIFDPFRLKGIPAYSRYFKDLAQYKALDGTDAIKFQDLRPQIYQKSITHNVSAHYFYQSAWAFRLIYESQAGSHTDIASDTALSALLSALIPVTFVDIRALDVTLHNLHTVAGDIVSLPYADQEFSSISCLHVIEHVGLGRYGDPLDPQGTQKAASELVRVLAPGGNLFVSVPIGRQRVVFNAHRILATSTVLSMFDGLELVEFSSVSDRGVFLRNSDMASFDDAVYSCGLFHFRAPGVKETA
jgi:SAM-dependent methyltransferase